MKSNYKNLPCLILAYNRPSNFKNLLSNLVNLEIQNIFIVIDGPKNELDKSKQDEMIECINNFKNKINLNFILRKRNLGCMLSVAYGIEWFFKNVSFGIILEDDCLPSKNFFRFCLYFQNILDKDPHVFAISGTNFISNKFNYFRKQNLYYKSKYLHVWGWATSKDKWVKIDLLKNLRNIEIKNLKNLSKFEKNYWSIIVNNFNKGQLNSWAYPLQCLLFSKNYQTITSSNRLIINNGFSHEATNTKVIYKNSDVKNNLDSKPIFDWEIQGNKFFELYTMIFHYFGLKRFILSFFRSLKN